MNASPCTVYFSQSEHKSKQMKKTLSQILTEKKQAKKAKVDNRTDVEKRLADKRFASSKVYK